MRNVRVVFPLVWGLFSIALIGALLAVSFTPTSGQTVSWMEPVQLSPSGSFSWFPDIAADRSGAVHVTWASGVPGFDAVIYTTSMTGEVWEPVNDIAAIPQENFGSAATRPAMAIDANGFLHLTYVDTTTLYYSRVPVWDATKAGAWTKRQVLSGNQTAYFSEMAIDSKGVIHLVFTQNFPTVACLNCFHLYYRQSTDNGNTWTDPIDISGGVEGAAKPQLLIDEQDYIHVVWEAGLGGGLGQLFDPTGVKYSASYDGGKTWSAPYAYAVPDNPNLKNITIGLDKNNSLVVVFWALPFDWVLYSVSIDSGLTWTNPLQIPGVWGAAEIYKSNLDIYSFAKDSAENLHLIMVGRKGLEAQTVDVLDLVWDSENWEEPITIAAYEGDVPEWPRAVVSRGNQLNVVWFVRDEAHIWESGMGRYQVWYAKGISAASPVDTQPYPTFTATALPTTPLPTASVTPSPTVEIVEPIYSMEESIRSEASKPAEDILYTEQDYLVLLGKAVVPALVFLVGAIAIAVIRKR